MRLLLALAVAAAAPLPGAPPYRDLLGRFALNVPAGWSTAPNAADETLTGSFAPSGGARLQIVAVELAPGLDLDGYVRNGLVAYKAIWTIRSDAPDRLGPLPARKLVLEQRIGADVTFQVKWFATDGKHVYVLTGASPLPAFPAARAHFDAAAASFVPGDWAAYDAGTGPTVYTEGPVRLALPAGWRLGGRREGRMALWRKAVGDRRATIILDLREDGTPQARLDREKATFADEPRWQVLAETPLTLGGAPGRSLVTRMRVDGDVGWEAIHAVSRGDQPVTLRFDVNDEAPAAALQADFDQVLAGLRWQ